MSGVIDIDVSELRGIRELLQPEVDSRMQSFVLRLGLKGESLLKQKTPVDTGRLRSSVSHTVDTDAMGVRIGSNVKYAPFIIGDAPPFIIQPKAAKALRFVVDGQVVFTKRAKHPGGNKAVSQVAELLRRERLA